MRKKSQDLSGEQLELAGQDQRDATFFSRHKSGNSVNTNQINIEHNFYIFITFISSFSLTIWL